MRRFAPTTIVALTFLCLAAAPAWAQSEAGNQASEVTDTEASEEGEKTADEAGESEEDKGTKLSDRIKSVQRKVFLKRRRVEIYPYFALDLNDAFFTHLIVGGAVAFHIVDSLAIEARGGGVIGSIEQDAIRFVRQETDSLLQDPPEFQYNAELDLLWAPFYGKISLFGEGILHFDTILAIGPGIFGTDAGLNPAANIGLGQRFFINDWLTVRVELRDYIFIDSRNGESDLQNLLMLAVSVSGFFPTSFEYEFQ